MSKDWKEELDAVLWDNTDLSGQQEETRYRVKPQLKQDIVTLIEKILKSKQEEVEVAMEKIREEKPIVSPPESDVYMHTLAQFNRVAGVNTTLNDLKPIINNILKP